jgi:DNA-binding MarR family transcriptional regulator
MIGLEMAGNREAAKQVRPNTYPDALATKIGFLLARAHLIARERADRSLAEIGLSMKGYAALATLGSDGPTSQQRLSQRIGMDPATMVDVIDALEASNHIVRRRNPQDRREYALHTTPRGKALLARAERAIEAAGQETFRDLDPGEAAILMRLLGRIADPSRTQKLATDEAVAEALGR